MPGRAVFVILLIALPAAVNTVAGQQNHEAASQVNDEARFEDLVAGLSKLGLRITADQQKIEEATSEAAYFMFAGRKEHAPKCDSFNLSGEGKWLDGKPVFAAKFDREKIYPLFNRLVKMMGYNEVRTYAADVHYGVSSYARFKLYRLGYAENDKRRGKKPEVLLGDADYVLKLP
jgi:hypothetical protein